MPHRKSVLATQHCAIRDACSRVAAGAQRRQRGRPRKCEAWLGCTIEAFVAYVGYAARETRHLDHIVPLSQGGDNHYSNYRLLPSQANQAKHARCTPEMAAAVALIRLRAPLG